MKKKLLSIVNEALEVENANLDDYLESYDDWDSLSKLTLIALIDEHFEIQISDKEFEECETVADIYKILEIKKS